MTVNTDLVGNHRKIRVLVVIFHRKISVYPKVNSKRTTPDTRLQRLDCTCANPSPQHAGLLLACGLAPPCFASAPPPPEKGAP